MQVFVSPILLSIKAASSQNLYEQNLTYSKDKSIKRFTLLKEKIISRLSSEVCSPLILHVLSFPRAVHLAVGSAKQQLRLQRHIGLSASLHDLFGNNSCSVSSDISRQPNKQQERRDQL